MHAHTQTRSLCLLKVLHPPLISRPLSKFSHFIVLAGYNQAFVTLTFFNIKVKSLKCKYEEIKLKYKLKTIAHISLHIWKRFQFQDVSGPLQGISVAVPNSSQFS